MKKQDTAARIRSMEMPARSINQIIKPRGRFWQVTDLEVIDLIEALREARELLNDFHEGSNMEIAEPGSIMCRAETLLEKWEKRCDKREERRPI